MGAVLAGVHRADLDCQFLRVLGFPIRSFAAIDALVALVKECRLSRQAHLETDAVDDEWGGRTLDRWADSHANRNLRVTSRP